MIGLYSFSWVVYSSVWILHTFSETGTIWISFHFEQAVVNPLMCRAIETNLIVQETQVGSKQLEHFWSRFTRYSSTYRKRMFGTWFISVVLFICKEYSGFPFRYWMFLSLGECLFIYLLFICINENVEVFFINHYLCLCSSTH